MRFNPIQRGAFSAPSSTLHAPPSTGGSPQGAKLKPLPIGTRVHCGLYGGNDGIIYHIRGEQKPETIGDMGGVVSFGGNAYFDIVFLGERAHLSNVPESIVRGVQWEILEGIATPAEIELAMENAERVRVANEAIAEQKRKEKAERADKYRREYSHLQPTGNGLHSSAKLGAMNIRTELKRAFPDVRFSVRSDHNSITVRWDLGPTTKEVEAITGRYQTGHFDGMTDCYEYDHEDAFTPIFGGAQFVTESRHIPEPLYEQIGRDLCALQHVAYNGIYTANLMGASDSQMLSDHLHQLTSRTSFPTGAKYKGVASVEWTAEMTDHHWCKIVFEEPIAVPPSTINSPPSTSVGGITLKHNDEKSGWELRFPNVPPESDRTELKAAGWRWSRFGGCWYHRDTPENKAFAESFLARHGSATCTPPGAVASPIENIENIEHGNHIADETKMVPSVPDTQHTASTVLHVDFAPDTTFTPPTTPRVPAWRQRSTR